MSPINGSRASLHTRPYDPFGIEVNALTFTEIPLALRWFRSVTSELLCSGYARSTVVREVFTTATFKLRSPVTATKEPFNVHML